MIHTVPLLAHHRLPSKLAKLAAAALVAGVVLLVIFWFFGKPYVERSLSDKLRILVAQQLNARLEIGRLRYRWPYGVQVDAAALHSTSPGEPSIKLIGFDRLDLQLAKLPFGKGPLVIERVDVSRPTLYVVETKENGFIGLEHLFRDPPATQDTQTPRLSDVLRLRHVQLTDARIEYDDRTIRRTVPFVWDNLAMRLDGAPQANSAVHYFKGNAGNGDTARIDAAGSIDFDSLVLTLDSLNLTTHVAPDQKKSSLPAGVQRVLNTLGVSGSGRATVSGNVPLLRTRDLVLQGDFVIDDAQGRFSPEGRPLGDLNIDGRIALHGRALTVDVGHFSFRRGPFGVSALPVTVNYHLKTDRWTTTPVRGAIAYVPPPGSTGILNQRATVMVAAKLTELGARDEFRIDLAGTRVLLPDTLGEVGVAGVAKYGDTGVTLERAATDALGGVVTAAGFVNENASSFVGELNFARADLDKLNRLIDPTAETALKGVLTGQVKGAITDTLDAARGEGQFRITGGQFGKVPFLGGVAESLNVGRRAWIAHEASGRFTFDKAGLTFSRFAVSTDVLSAVGKGDVAYDGKLSLSVYADGHWKEKPKPDELYVPVLSEIGRALAAAGAYTFGSVSRQFTHFTVTGTTESPKVSLSPAPVLTESIERVFKGE